jgi:hypothetical protein
VGFIEQGEINSPLPDYQFSVWCFSCLSLAILIKN